MNSDLDDEDYDNPVLPRYDREEFRPFIRSLPEFKFWKHATIATTIANFMTWFKAFDQPVNVFILIFYFIIVFIITMKN